jgi:hypothetical protein
MQTPLESTSSAPSGSPVDRATIDITPHTATTSIRAEGAAEGVTQNVSEAPSVWATPPLLFEADQLRDARWLPLSAVGASPDADALVAEIAAHVAHHEATCRTRRRGRRQAGLAKQRQAVSAILGGVLRRWGRPEPLPVFRSRTPSGFSGGPVAARQYLGACDAMVALGLLHQSRSIRYGSGIVWDEGGPEHFAGKAPRLWPTLALLEIAGRHGVTPVTLPHDFRDVYPAQPPSVPQPLQMFTLKQPRKSEKAPIAVRKDDPKAARLVEKVTGYNEWIAQHDVVGCLPPRLKRVFTASWLLGGRWYAVGAEGNYQRMSETERLGLTINGEPVAEADVQASHLSIMHGLLGLPLPDGDPYEFSELPRLIAKAWITATLGKGTPVTKWAIKAAKDNPTLLEHDPRQTGRVVCERYPFLRLMHIGTPERLLTHRLMAIEAQALTGAMGYLKGRGVMALPMHDGLIVPGSGARYVGGGLDGAFSWAANRVRVRWTVAGLDRYADG